MARANKSTVQEVAGLYRGSVQGNPATLTLSVRAGVIEGRLDVAGYPYVIEKTSNACTLKDGMNGGHSPCRLQQSGDIVTLTLTSAGPTEVTIEFTADGAPLASPEPISPATIDGRLVGAWRQSTEMVSDGASFVSENFFTLHPDNTYSYREGRTMAGGPSWAAAQGGRSAVTGYWFVQGGELFMQPPGSTPLHIGRYHVEDTRMLITEPDGTRVIWYRR